MFEEYNILPSLGCWYRCHSGRLGALVLCVYGISEEGEE
jgi:hypothetical protein